MISSSLPTITELNITFVSFDKHDYNLFYPNRRTDDIGKIELQNLITRYDLYDAWRKLHPNKKRYSFQRGNSKSRIDFILCSNGLCSKVFDTNIKHFPFSDHDLVSTKLKLDDIERGPGIWAMNFNTITSELFTKAFNTSEAFTMHHINHI
jgi:hypothetical protein